MSGGVSDLPTSEDADLFASVACISTLLDHGIPADTVELLIYGSKSRGIKPGALTKTIKATIQAYHQFEANERAIAGAS